MTIAIGTHLGRYKIISQLGAGGMGEVFLATDSQLERSVALKVLPAEFCCDAERVQRFKQEARAASALNHPNIITIHEIGEVEDRLFIATEFIDGETLREKILKNDLSIYESVRIAEQVAAGLSVAHQAHIIHRDIKPENIMIRSDGYAKILDFGLAKLVEKKTKMLDAEAETRAQVNTRPGMIMGSVSYMSPEQARGRDIDERTDVWSLGVCLYEMLTGKNPFAGETVSDSLAALIHVEPEPLNENLPAELQRIVRKTLQKDANKRYQTVKDLLIDLEDAAEELKFQNKLERTASPNREETKTQILNATTTDVAQTTSRAGYVVSEVKKRKSGFAIGIIVLLFSLAGLGYWFFATRSANNKQIESVAVLPFVNESGNADNEYLSDGMTESLITSLSQLPKLSVKARNSVFRYKGKEVEARKVGAELSVQAILLGRVVQRGQDLTLYVELIDAATENVLWKADYNRSMSNLVLLQSDIAKDVSNKLKTKLSGADEEQVTKTYTGNTEAYQLYLKGRYHAYKTTRADYQKSISYFQQAIEIDPNYALPYVGLADAYRALSLAGEMSSTEVMPKAKAAAQKAIEIDDSLAEAHAHLGFIIFWYDWDWNAAENQYKRALELNPNSADAHLFYAHLLSNIGRHTEALAEAKRAIELDPLNLRTNALEGQFLIHAGRTDEALTQLQKTLELEPNYWLARNFAASAYIEKGMYTEAIAEARKARELYGLSTHPVANFGYALAKSGKQAEARVVLEELLKLSTAHYVSPYSIALIYNGLDERDETLAWLERGIEKREPRVAFLKVEPKWNNLRDDPRFQELMRRVGLPQ
jgi:serine/threonine-protein kinase